MQEEVEGRNVWKVTICLSGETPRDTDLPLDGDTRGDFRCHSKELVAHAGMENFHKILVADVAVTATHASAILTVNRDKKHEISLAVRSKDRKYRSDRLEAKIVEDIISKEKTSQQVSFSDKQVDTMKDFSMPRMFLSENRHSSTITEDLSKIWDLSLSQDALSLKATTQKMNRSEIIPLARRYRSDRMFGVLKIHGTISTNTIDSR